jgi:hypothetical protein
MLGVAENDLREVRWRQKQTMQKNGCPFQRGPRFLEAIRYKG